MTIDYLQARIGLDATPFKQGMNDAVASARRGATEIAVAYATTSSAMQALAKSTSLVSTAMKLGSGNPLSMFSAIDDIARMDSIAKTGRDAAETGAQISAMQQKLNAMPSAVAKVVEAFAVFQAVTTVWKAFNAAIEDTEVRMARLNAIGAAARELGTGSTFLTTLIAQARELKVETETLTGMLTRAREASRVQIGVGKDAVNESAIQTRLRQNVMASNLTQADVEPYNAARDQEAQIRAILDLLEKLKASNRELAANDLGKTFFGADFEAKTRQGIDLIGAMRAALDGAKVAGGGLAPTPEEIARTQEMAARQEAIAATIRDAIAPAVHDFNALSDVGKATWLDWEEHVAGWVKWLGEGYLKIRDVAAEVRKMGQDWGLIGQAPGTTMVPEGESAPLTMRVRVRPKAPDRSNPLPSLGSGGKARAARDPQDQDSVANVIRQLEKTRDIAEAELRTVGLSNVEKEKAVSLAKAEAAARADVEKGVRTSAALTADELARATNTAEATARAKDRLMDIEQQLHANADAARYFGSALADALGDAVLEGRSLTDILNSLSKMLSRGALQALLTGQGPLAGIMGMAPAASGGRDAVGGLAGMVMGMFGGGGSSALLSGVSDPDALADVPMFATGISDLGIVSGPGTGTSDSILARLSDGESVITARATAKHRPLIEAMNADKLPGFAAGRIGDAVASMGMDAAVRANADSAAASSAGAQAEPGVKFIVNEAPGGDRVGPQTTRRGQDGSLEVVADMLERRTADRLSRNRGPVSSVIGNPGRLRGT